ncbi:MAG: hypothetical protein M5U34_31550 [Chloroflexi bacterium]|nr:hypothetical protein [Chloroflexota bacterium]
MKRIVGGIMFVVGIMGVILAGLGFYFGRDVIDQIGNGLNSGLVFGAGWFGYDSRYGGFDKNGRY